MLGEVARFGVLGTGQVGQTVASRLVAGGHEVVMGSRTTDNAAAAWAAGAGGLADHATFARAAVAAEVVFHRTAGAASLGFPPTLTHCNTTRGAEMVLPLWVRLYGVLGTGGFNLAVVR